MRKIHRGGEEQPARPMGRKVNVSQSRREVHSAAENRTRAPKAPKTPKPPKEKSKHPILRFIGRTLATVLCLGIMLGSVVAVGMVFYVVQATANDGDLLDLDNIQLSQSSMVVATDPDTGAQVEYATLRSSNSHRVWADLEQIPSNLQYAFICTEDKDFYSEPGVNFKRTIGAMINEYLLPIYSSKQGASTLEQQLIKNLTDDNSASGIDGALRKVREIYRALCLSRSYSKETILEAYLNTISFTGTIQGVQTAANEYFNKDVSQLSLWECATIASITKNPTNYNPYTNPENLIHRRNFIMYNMWQQGVISEEDYRNGAAQPLVLAEEDSGKKPSTVTSYFTDALFNEVVQDIMTKEGISESEAQKLLYTGGFTIEATVNTKLQSQMENLMLNTDDAYFPPGWRTGGGKIYSGPEGIYRQPGGAFGGQEYRRDPAGPGDPGSGGDHRRYPLCLPLRQGVSGERPQRVHLQQGDGGHLRRRVAGTGQGARLRLPVRGLCGRRYAHHHPHAPVPGGQRHHRGGGHRERHHQLHAHQDGAGGTGL